MVDGTYPYSFPFYHDDNHSFTDYFGERVGCSYENLSRCLIVDIVIYVKGKVPGCSGVEHPFGFGFTLIILEGEANKLIYYIIEKSGRSFYSTVTKRCGRISLHSQCRVCFIPFLSPK